MNKIFLFFIIFFSLHTFSDANVLKKRISITVAKTPLHEVLKLLEQESQSYFVYKASVINKNRLITISFEDILLEDLLKILLYEDGAKFSVVNNYVVIYKANAIPPKAEDTIMYSPIRDTIWEYITVTDTAIVEIADTLCVYDTIPVERNVAMEHVGEDKFIDMITLTSSATFFSDFSKAIMQKYISADNANSIKGSAFLLLSKDSKYFTRQVGLGFSNESVRIPYTTYEYSEKTLYDTIYDQTKNADSILIYESEDNFQWLVLNNEKQFSVDSNIVDVVKSKDHLHKISAHYIDIPIQLLYKKNISCNFNLIAFANWHFQMLLNSKNSKVIYYNENAEKYLYFEPSRIKTYGALGVGFKYELFSKYHISVFSQAVFQTTSGYSNRSLNSKENVHFNVAIQFAYVLMK